MFRRSSDHDPFTLRAGLEVRAASGSQMNETLHGTRRGWMASGFEFARLLWPRHRHAATGGNALRVLALVRPGPNRRLIEAVSFEAGWTLTVSDLPPAEGAKCAVVPAPIILFDRDLPPGNWRETIASLTRRSPRPYLILLSPNSDGNLWDELQRVGGSDILRTPIDRESTLQAVRRAWSLWHSQQQARRAVRHHR